MGTDPWVDDGSVSRAEPRWLQEKRRRRRQQQLKEQQLRSTNPFDPPANTSGTNPFDSSSSSTASSSVRATPPVTPKRRPINPFDSDSHSSSIPRRRGTNPFDSASTSTPTSVRRTPTPRKNLSYAVDYSNNSIADSSTATTTSALLMRKHGKQKQDQKSVADSLDRILNTTEEVTVTDNSSHDDTTVSEHAINAAEALKKSFFTSRSKNATPSPSRQQHEQNYSSIQSPKYPSSAMEKRLARRALPTPPTIPEMSQASIPSPRQPSNSNSPYRPRPPVRRPSQPVDLDVTIDSETTTTMNSTSLQASQSDLALHDLCDEASSTDDIAWRNAMFLLSMQPNLASVVEPDTYMTPLHVCCLGLQPPPIWITRGLLYSDSESCRRRDSGGRLPLHLLAATSADPATMQLLVEENPASVTKRDQRGFTPLQLLLKNDRITLRLEHMRILLGQHLQTTITEESDNMKGQTQHLSLRKRQHLNQTVQDLEQRRRRQLEKEQRHEESFVDYPEDVLMGLNNITQWKRRQVRQGTLPKPSSSSQEHPEQQDDDADFDYDVSPASIATPTGKLLPLHLLVRRPCEYQPSETLTSTPPASQEDLVRVLIAAYPQALITRDVHGRTPLLTAMVNSNKMPPTDVLELLLGLRTAGYIDSGTFQTTSPAQLASEDSFQLPLHVAAEECASDYRLLQSIFEAYPPARLVQDARGRTPLHLALANYQSVPIDAATLELLFVESVAKLKDDDGKRPLDLVIANPKCLERQTEASSTLMIQQFLDASIDNPNDWRESQDLLRQLRKLPPWLRRHACAAQFVQATLLEEVASIGNTFLLLLLGCVLVLLLLVIRYSLETGGADTWVLVYYFASYLLVTQIVHGATTLALGEFYRLSLSNIWRWIDLATGTMAIGTAYLVSVDTKALDEVLESSLGSFLPAEKNELIAIMGAWATGFCWISIVGFLVQWWYGMAVFIGSAVHLFQTLFWPLGLAGMGIVAMSQILYTLEDCGFGDDTGGCSLSDAYTTIYWLILGEPVIHEDGYQTLSRSMTALLVTFIFLWIWWVVSVLVMTVSEAYRIDRQQIALRWYWEPKIALTIFVGDKPKFANPPSYVQRYCDQMETLWHILASSIQGGVQNKKGEVHWYACCFRPGVIILTRLAAIIVLPIWWVLGLVSLGILWPPQVRRWLFNWCSSGSIKNSTKQPSTGGERLTAAKLSNLKADVLKYQSIALEHNNKLQQDIAQIKGILLRAMKEEEDSRR